MRRIRIRNLEFATRRDIVIAGRILKEIRGEIHNGWRIHSILMHAIRLNAIHLLLHARRVLDLFFTAKVAQSTIRFIEIPRRLAVLILLQLIRLFVYKHTIHVNQASSSLLASTAIITS